MRALVAAILEEAGYEVVEAADGPQFLECLADTAARCRHGDRSIDLVLLDMKLTGLCGVRALEILRAGPWAATPILAMTSFQDEALDAQAEHMGAVLLPDRDVRPARLVRLVQSVLR